MNVPGLIVIVTLCCLDGLVIFAVYSGCDLIKDKKITSNDQVKAWFITILTSSEFLETFHLCTQSSFVPYSVMCGLVAIEFQSCYNLNRADKLTK